MSHTCIVISVIIKVFTIDSGCVWELFFHVKVEKDAPEAAKSIHSRLSEI